MHLITAPPLIASSNCNSMILKRCKTYSYRTLATHCQRIPTLPATTSGTDSDANPPLPPPSFVPTSLSQEQLERNSQLLDSIKGKLILAPLTRGGNLPFRRLCIELGGGDVPTFSEMAFARQLLKGDPKEKAMLRKAPNEQIFGFQIATKQIDEGVAAAKMAAEAGATFIDLNCGCPIYEATRRGLGSSLLKKPKKLARLVNGIATKSPIPVTVKVRVGINSSSINIEEVTELLRQAGAAAVSIHGRTAEARYKKPASWELIQKVAESKVKAEVVVVGGGGGGGGYHHQQQVPIIGNGDVLTHYEATRRLGDHGCHAVMVGRGALTKPWIFGEVRDGKEYDLTSQERIGIYRQLTTYMKEHFGDDDKGKRKAFYFLPWHFDFLTRWRPLPEGVYGELSKQQPLISTRWDSIACTAMGQRVEDMTLLDRLLSCDNREGAHPAMADALWEAGSDQDAVVKFKKLAEEHLVEWEEQSGSGGDDGRDGRDRGDMEAQG